jgi:hypothetical protein
MTIAYARVRFPSKRMTQMRRVAKGPVFDMAQGWYDSLPSANLNLVQQPLRFSGGKHAMGGSIIDLRGVVKVDPPRGSFPIWSLAARSTFWSPSPSVGCGFLY